MLTLQIGTKARVITEIECDGFEEDNVDSAFTCIINIGAEVEVAGEPVSSRDTSTGREHWMIPIKVPDTEGIMRETIIDLEDLTIATLS